MTEVIALEDIKGILDHYWREYSRPKEVRDVLEDIAHDVESLSYNDDEP